MTARFVGRSAVWAAIVTGREVLGIPTAESLSVDADTDVAVDSGADLDVVEGVSWTGVMAAQSIAYAGAAATTLSEAEI